MSAVDFYTLDEQGHWRGRYSTPPRGAYDGPEPSWMPPPSFAAPASPTVAGGGAVAASSLSYNQSRLLDMHPSAARDGAGGVGGHHHRGRSRSASPAAAYRRGRSNGHAAARPITAAAAGGGGGATAYFSALSIVSLSQAVAQAHPPLLAQLPIALRQKLDRLLADERSQRLSDANDDSDANVAEYRHLRAYIEKLATVPKHAMDKERDFAYTDPFRKVPCRLKVRAFHPEAFFALAKLRFCRTKEDGPSGHVTNNQYHSHGECYEYHAEGVCTYNVKCRHNHECLVCGGDGGGPSSSAGGRSHPWTMVGSSCPTFQRIEEEMGRVSMSHDEIALLAAALRKL